MKFHKQFFVGMEVCMSLRFIYGNAISLKSTYAYQYVIFESEKNPKQMYQVIVPEQATLLTQQQILRLHPRKSLLNIDIVSFQRLAYRVMEELNEQSPHILDDTGKSMILRRITSEQSSCLEAFTGNLSRRGFIEQLKSMMSEFLQYGIQPNQLEYMANNLEEQPLLQRKLHDLQKIYVEFRNTMGSGQITAEELLPLLCKWIPESEQVKNSVFVLDGFTGFTPVQYQLLELLLQYAKEVNVVLTADPQENLWHIAGDYELFYMSKTVASTLGKMADKLGVSVEKSIIVTKIKNVPSAIKTLEEGLFRYPVIPYKKEQNVVQIYRARTPKGEVRHTLQQILTLVREQKYRYGEIAIVCGDMESYVPLIQQEFGKINLPIFIDRKKNLLHNPLVELIRSVLEVIEEDFSYESVFHYVRNALYQLDCSMFSDDINDFASNDKIEQSYKEQKCSENRVKNRYLLDSLENYVKALGIRGSKRWKKEWKKTYKGMSLTPDLETINGIKNQIFDAVILLKEAFETRETVKTINIRLYELLEKLSVQEKLFSMAVDFSEQGELLMEKEYMQCFEKVIGLLEQLTDIMGDEVVSLSDYSDILDSGFENLQVGLVPPAIDRLIVGDVERSRIEGVRALFLLGVNEGILPVAKEKGGLLSDLDRERLKEMNLELAPTSKEEGFTQKYYLYLMMTKPSQYLFLSYSVLSEEGKSLRPSYLIGMLKKIFSSLKECVQEDEEQYTGKEMVMTKDNSMEVLLRAISQYEKDPSVDWWKDLYTWYYTHEPYRKQLMYGLEGMFVSYEKEELSQPLAARIFGAKPLNSVTRLERFAGCAYAHFLAYGLGLKEREEYELEAIDYGNIFHSSLELFFKLLQEEKLQWRDITDEQRIDLVKKSVKQVTLDYGNTILQSSARNQYLASRLEKMTDRTVWALTKQLKAGSFDSSGSEVNFSAQNNTPSLRLDVGEGLHMDLQGRIDRMDILEDDNKVYVKVIDYKSGGTSFDITKLYYGLQLQLILYLSAAMEIQERKNPNKEAIPAGVYYYNMKNPIVDAPRLEEKYVGDEKQQEILDNAVKEEVEKSILEQLRMNGLSNENPQILEMLDHTDNKKSLVIKNLSRDESGMPKGRSQVASTEQMKNLCHYGKKKAENLGSQMMKGNISVNPYEYKGKTACDYCEYGGVCGFDTGIEGYRYRRLNNMELNDVWNYLEQRKDSIEEENTTNHNELQSEDHLKN